MHFSLKTFHFPNEKRKFFTGAFGASQIFRIPTPKMVRGRAAKGDSNDGVGQAPLAIPNVRPCPLLTPDDPSPFPMTSNLNAAFFRCCHSRDTAPSVERLQTDFMSLVDTDHTKKCPMRFILYASHQYKRLYKINIKYINRI